MKTSDYEDVLDNSCFSGSIVFGKHAYIRLMTQDCAYIHIEKKENYSFAELINYLHTLEFNVKARLIEIEVYQFKQTPIYSAIVKEFEERLDK